MNLKRPVNVAKENSTTEIIDASEIDRYFPQLEEILEACRIKLSDIKPSDWAEKHRYMDSSVSPYPGKFSYDITPYAREIVDCLAPDHPSKKIAVMKGAQIGFSSGVIESGIGWIIDNKPGNIILLTGHADLSEEAILKVDQMIDSCGIRYLIHPNVQRRRGTKTGDTNTKKEFPGGSLIAGSSGNHKLLRQRSVMYGFIDDFDAAKQSTKESGSTTKMIEQRFAANYAKMKLFYISTPELKATSNIEPEFLKGDQRRYHVPCPCCGEYIPLFWTVDIEGSEGKEKGGITWKVDDKQKIIRKSVGYICQKCGGFFDDRNKYEMNLSGLWVPTAEPSEPNYYSYHISSLYAPPGMYNWAYYVGQYLEANPPNSNQVEHLQKTFVNLCLGETFEPKGEAIKANQLQKNIRNYEIGSMPNKLSLEDGNGEIVLLTCAADLNGVVDDARIDYEVVAWTETGTSYSVSHGSIGTFVPRERAMKYKADRPRFTYEFNKENSVWPLFDQVLSTEYCTDTGRRMKVMITGLDCGHYTQYAYYYIDHSNFHIVGVKGKDEDKYIRFGVDIPCFKPARERANLYLLEVNQIKDQLADRINLKWDKGMDPKQPAGYLNFPTPSGGLYLFDNFFSHYESEHRVTELKEGKSIASKWVKKTSTSQNHLFDCHVYNMAIKEIMTMLLCKELKIKNYTWKDFVKIIMGKYDT